MSEHGKHQAGVGEQWLASNPVALTRAVENSMFWSELDRYRT